MKIHIIAKGHVFGEGKKQYSYSYICKMVDNNYKLSTKIDLAKACYPHTYKFHYLFDASEHEQEIDENYLETLQEYLCEYYSKKIPKEDEYDEIYEAVKAKLNESIGMMI